MAADHSMLEVSICAVLDATARLWAACGGDPLPTNVVRRAFDWQHRLTEGGRVWDRPRPGRPFMPNSAALHAANIKKRGHNMSAHRACGWGKVRHYHYISIGHPVSDGVDVMRGPNGALPRAAAVSEAMLLAHCVLLACCVCADTMHTVLQGGALCTPRSERKTVMRGACALNTLLHMFGDQPNVPSCMAFSCGYICHAGHGKKHACANSCSGPATMQQQVRGLNRGVRLNGHARVQRGGGALDCQVPIIEWIRGCEGVTPHGTPHEISSPIRQNQATNENGCARKIVHIHAHLMRRSARASGSNAGRRLAQQ